MSIIKTRIRGNVIVTPISGGGDGGGAGTIIVQDEGIVLGTATTINLVGDGVSAAIGGGIATITVPGGGGAAMALQTTVADVDVSASDPPIAGQVLTAVDATHATWQDVPSGPGGSGNSYFPSGW